MSFEKTQFNEQILKHTQTNDCQTMMVGELAMVLLGNQACKKGTCIQRRPWVEDLILERQESWPAFQDQMFGYTVVALVMFFHHFLLRIQLISLWSTFHRWIFYFLDFTHTHTHTHTHTPAHTHWWHFSLSSWYSRSTCTASYRPQVKFLSSSWTRETDFMPCQVLPKDSSWTRETDLRFLA